MDKTKILYMGTTIFSAHILEELCKANYNIVGLVSQPDRKVGRKKEIKFTATKEVALKYGIKTIAFDNINNHLDEIKSLNPDLIVTCAFGQKLSKELLLIPPMKCINVHASLLPRHRGGAPIHYAILSGDKVSGNTIMYMEEGLDTGDMLAKSEVSIDDNDTTKDLHDKLMFDGANLLLKTLPDLIAGKLVPEKQDNSMATYSPNISRDLEFIEYNRPTQEVYNHMRGLISVPGCYSYLNGKSIKFQKVRMELASHNHQIGSIEVDDKEYFKIYTIDGYIKVYQFQLEGKKSVLFSEYINGNKLEIKTGVVLNKREL